MPIQHVPSVGDVGIIKDLSAHELPINAWTDGNNVEFVNGYVKQCLGYSAVSSAPTSSMQHVMMFKNGATEDILYCCGTSVYVSQSYGSPTNITGPSIYFAAWNTTSCLLSGIPILNDGYNVPQYWDKTITHTLANLTNWQAGYLCGALRSYKNYLVALDVTKSGTRYPYMVKWSHPADPGSLPASWDQTDATKDAGEYDLAEGGDLVVDGLQLRDSFIVYKENSAWRMDYVGGDYVMRFAKIDNMAGIAQRGAVVDIGGRHVVYTGSDLMIHDGINAKSVMDGKVREYIIRYIQGGDQAFLLHVPARKCVWLCFSDSRQSLYPGYTSMAVSWNYVTDTIALHNLPYIAHGCSARNVRGWSSTVTAKSANATIMVGRNSPYARQVDAAFTNNGTAISSYIERTGLVFGAPEKRKIIKAILPRIFAANGATMTIKCGSQADPYTAPTAWQSQTFTVGTTERCPFTVDGRYIAIRIETGTATEWRLDSYSVEYDLAGEY